MEPGKGELLIKAHTNSGQLEPRHHTLPDLEREVAQGHTTPDRPGLPLRPTRCGDMSRTSTPVPSTGEGRTQQRAGGGLQKSSNLGDSNWNPGVGGKQGRVSGLLLKKAKQITFYTRSLGGEEAPSPGAG